MSSNGDVRLTRPLIKASGLTPVLTGLKWSHFSRFLSMDISVATFPFLVFTVKSLEQFPYTVSYGSRRYNRQIQRGKTFLGALERTGKGAGRKGRSDMDLEDLPPPRQSVGIAGAWPARGVVRTRGRGF